MTQNSFFDRIFRDKDGNFVIAQMPNLPLIVWIATTALKLVFTSGNIYVAMDTVAFGSLFTWAWQELFEGVNYFRRGLGFAVLVGIIALRMQ
jgi:hypothetical protein